MILVNLKKLKNPDKKPVHMDCMYTYEINWYLRNSFTKEKANHEKFDVDYTQPKAHVEYWSSRGDFDCKWSKHENL